MPGTLWCGAGDSAGNFTELGVFQGPDVCCREHDQCEALIPALGYNYGLRNFRFHTVSHCDCDARFRQCLMDANDTISNLVGVSFFNLLEVPCFVLEESEECVEWHWWGGCKTYGLMPLARMVEQSYYHATMPFVESSGVATPPPEHRRGRGRKKNRKHKKHPEWSRLPPEGSDAQDAITVPLSSSSLPDLIAHSPGSTSPGTVSISKGMGSLSPTLKTTSRTESPDVQQTHTVATGLPDEAGQIRKASSDLGQEIHPAGTGNRVPLRSCSCYHRLDQCPYRIAPNEVKYQLQNLDSRTLFHCNCTRKLARFLRRTKGPNEVEGEVLANYVSSSCFVLQTPPGCREGEDQQPNCIDVGKAVLAPARHLTNRLTRKPAGTSLKVKRQERTHPDQPLRLFEKCKQLARNAKRHARPH